MGEVRGQVPGSSARLGILISQELIPAWSNEFARVALDRTKVCVHICDSMQL